VLECDECPEMPECPVCPEPEPCPEVAPVDNANGTVVESEVIVDAEPEDKPTALPTKKTLPGFESVFALAGLLAVAYLVLRQRE
jgi:PGF-CTERM protein